MSFNSLGKILELQQDIKKNNNSTKIKNKYQINRDDTHLYFSRANIIAIDIDQNLNSDIKFKIFYELPYIMIRKGIDTNTQLTIDSRLYAPDGQINENCYIEIIKLMQLLRENLKTLTPLKSLKNNELRVILLDAHKNVGFDSFYLDDKGNTFNTEENLGNNIFTKAFKNLENERINENQMFNPNIEYLEQNNEYENISINRMWGDTINSLEDKIIFTLKQDLLIIGYLIVIAPVKTLQNTSSVMEPNKKSLRKNYNSMSSYHSVISKNLYYFYY